MQLALGEIDEGRFGLFYYHQYDQVNDERVERYLPPKATRITIFKTAHGGGYVAHYLISEEDLLGYVDGLWNDYGEFSVETKEETQRFADSIRSEPEFEMLMSELGKQPPEVKQRCSTPVGGNGAGARYYFIPETDEVYQFSGYW